MEGVKLIKAWCMLECTRYGILAKLTGFTEGYIRNIASGNAELRNEAVYYKAMALVDNIAATDVCRVEKIINRCMRFSKHEDLEIRNFARGEFNRWTALLTEE